MAKNLVEIRRGLDIPIKGEPQQAQFNIPPTRSVGVLGRDYVGLAPSMLVREGDEVAAGTPVFRDKRNPCLQVVAPSAGTVVAVHRGARRKLESVEIAVDGDGQAPEIAVAAASLKDKSATREQKVDALVTAGLWSGIRERPFHRCPEADSAPSAVFISTIDSNPLALEPAVWIRANATDFNAGMEVLADLVSPQCKIYVTVEVDEDLPIDVDDDRISLVECSGPHPIGLVSTQAHYLHPVDLNHRIWEIGYQCVAGIGHLVTNGTINTTQQFALGGPRVEKARILDSQVGVDLSELTEKLVTGDASDARVVSGSLLSGHQAVANERFLGRFHTQCAVIDAEPRRRFMAWMMPGFDCYSSLPVFGGALRSRNHDFTFDAGVHGGARGHVPIGVYDELNPFRFSMSPLLRAILTSNIEEALELGVLELVPEDLALITFASPSKYDFCGILADFLEKIRTELG